MMYYRKDDNDIKYLDVDASMEEQVADLDLICDKWVYILYTNYVSIKCAHTCAVLSIKFNIIHVGTNVHTIVCLICAP